MKMDLEVSQPFLINDNSSNIGSVSSFQNKDCLPPDLLRIMINLLGPDSETSQKLLDQNCSIELNTTASSTWAWDVPQQIKEDLNMLNTAKLFYAYLTPFIIVIGLIGNILSVKIFTCRRMRKVSASFYLTALAISDSLVLITYVLLDWMPLGMKFWPGGRILDIRSLPGMCQTCLFFAYMFRFISAWLIVIFTVERFIGVCKPLHRRAWCTHALAKKAIGSIILSALVISSYKPALSGVIRQGNMTICTRSTEHVMLNFTLDGLYACSITAIPFGIIMVLNCLIIIRLNKTKRRHQQTKFSVDESSIKLEFTAILLIISTTFVVLNLPYFIIWCVNFHRQIHNWMSLDNPTDAERTRAWMYITKTIFFGNYCVNFFLYSMTGAYFRRQLLNVVCQDIACNSNLSNSATQLQGFPLTIRLAPSSQRSHRDAKDQQTNNAPKTLHKSSSWVNSYS